MIAIIRVSIKKVNEQEKKEKIYCANWERVFKNRIGKNKTEVYVFTSW